MYVHAQLFCNGFFFQINLRAQDLSLNIGTPLMQLAAVDISFDYASIMIFQSSSKQSFTSDIVITVYTQTNHDKSNV